MRIYVIAAREAVDYDSYNRHVVAAHTEQEARDMCPHGDEVGYAAQHTPDFWTNPKHSTARHVGASLKHLEPEVLCSSYRAG